MAKITIRVEGVSLAYLKSGTWRIIFPFGGPNDCHPVTFDSDQTGPIDLAQQAAREINITTKNPSTTSAPGSQFNNFLDLTQQNVTHANLVMRGGWENHGVLMKIDNAIMSQLDPLDCRWGLKLSGTNPVTGYKQFAYSAELQIEAGQVLVDIPEVLNEPLVFEDDATISLNNTCGQNQYASEGDLTMLYHYIVRDPAGYEFSMVRHPDDAPEDFDDINWPGLEKDQILELLNKLVFAAKPENPGKGVPGLPCNIFVSTQTTDLV